MNSFFLNVSFPRTRREVPILRGDRGKLAYTGQNHFPFLLTLAPFVNLTVDTFPDKRGQLTLPILFIAYSFDS